MAPESASRGPGTSRSQRPADGAAGHARPMKEKQAVVVGRRHGDLVVGDQLGVRVDPTARDGLHDVIFAIAGKIYIYRP